MGFLVFVVVLFCFSLMLSVHSTVNKAQWDVSSGRITRKPPTSSSRPGIMSFPTYCPFFQEFCQQSFSIEVPGMNQRMKISPTLCDIAPKAPLVNSVFSSSRGGGWGPDLGSTPWLVYSEKEELTFFLLGSWGQRTLCVDDSPHVGFWEEAGAGGLL